MLATAYLGLVPSGNEPHTPSDTAWHPVDDLPRTAFDHHFFIDAAIERLRAKLSYTNIGFCNVLLFDSLLLRDKAVPFENCTMVMDRADADRQRNM